ncbi:DUF4238 domain-containing protein [Burkholderia ubonensis]|uniref:DUF4238 domain-containing protein n=1 Tax=Burkholderia ubonensis TaxID=101571 RepID=UPI0009B3CF50|nr:DUF4238 domain-containing protein [Burkholderia ubonensis]
MKNNKENSNKNRNQHYVPENYFLEFSKDGSSVCGLFKKSGKAEPNISFGGQSSEHWFYGDAEREDKITEFDTKYCDNRRAVLRDLANGAPSLSPEQVDTLLENTQFQRKRTLTFRKAEQGVHEFHEYFFAPQVEDLENYDSGHSKEATEAVKKAMGLFFKAFSDPRDSQFVNLMLIDTDEVSDLELVILRNRTSLPFIFSDSPVAYTNPALSDFKCSKIANNSVGLQIFYPLNSEFLVLFYDAAVYRVGESSSVALDITNDGDVSQINKLQLHEAANSIYFGHADDLEYVKMLWREERGGFEPNKKSIVSAPEITAEGYETGRTIFSTTESEPSFYPSLSFVTGDLSKSNLPYRESYWRKFNSEGAEIPRINDLIDRCSLSKSKE